MFYSHLQYLSDIESCLTAAVAGALIILLALSVASSGDSALMVELSFDDFFEAELDVPVCCDFELAEATGT